jgi:hypothetical protein
MTGPQGVGMDLNVQTTFSSTGINLNNFGSYWTPGTTGGVIGTTEYIFKTAVSGSGQYQSFVTNGNTGGTGNGFVYFSNDYGTTFTKPATIVTQPYNSVAISTTGQYIVASYYVPNIVPGDPLNILFSSDWGTTWTLKNAGPARDYYNNYQLSQGVTISSTGQYIYYVITSDVQKSADYGASFFNSGGIYAGNITRSNMCTSATGQYVLVAQNGYDGRARFSNNYFNPNAQNQTLNLFWTNSESCYNILSVGMSANAQYSYAGQGLKPTNSINILYRNPNYLIGQAFATTCTIPWNNANSGFYSISVSETGQYVTAGGFNGGGVYYVFTSSDFGNVSSGKIKKGVFFCMFCDQMR